MTCRKCGNTDIAIATTEKQQAAGCLTVILYVLLAATILGLFIVIPLMLRGKKSKTVTTCVCKNCGYKWTI